MARSRSLVLNGVFDEEAARFVSETVARLGMDEVVVIDCRSIHDFHDSALGVLASALKQGEGRVEIQGLCEHQRRLLRYLGVNRV